MQLGQLRYLSLIPCGEAKGIYHRCNDCTDTRRTGIIPPYFAEIVYLIRRRSSPETAICMGRGMSTRAWVDIGILEEGVLGPRPDARLPACGEGTVDSFSRVICGYFLGHYRRRNSLGEPETPAPSGSPVKHAVEGGS